MSESHSLQQNQEPVLTYWWFDNFDRNVDSHTGKGGIDSTRIVEFSERNEVNLASSAAANVPRSKRRSLAPSGTDLSTVKVDKLKEPSVISSPLSEKLKQQMDKETKTLDARKSSIIKRLVFTHIFGMVYCYTNWSVG